MVLGLLVSPAAVFAAGKTTLSWLTHVPGARASEATCVRVNTDGTVWVAGTTRSSFDEFPAQNDPRQAQLAGGSDVFIAKYRLDAGGRSTLLYWTWLGGAEDETLKAMEIGPNGRLYIAGTTTSTDFPTAGPFQASSAGDLEGFVAVIDPLVPGPDSLLFSSYFGGTGDDVPNAIAVHPDGSVAIVGYSTSGDMPMTGSVVQGSNRGGYETFILKVNPFVGSPLQYSSYFGGTSTDSASGVVFDADGSVWITGSTASSDFPITEDSAMRSQIDGFLVHLDLNRPELSALLQAFYFGGDQADVPTQIARDSRGLLYLTGYTFSSDFPATARAYQRELRGEVDSFLFVFNPQLSNDSRITYSSYIGGSGMEVPYTVVPSDDGRVRLAGYVSFGGFPIVGEPMQSASRSAYEDGFVASINTQGDAAGTLEYSTYLGGKYGDVLTSIGVDRQGAVYVAGYSYSPDLPATDGSAKGSAPGLEVGFAAKVAVE